MKFSKVFRSEFSPDVRAQGETYVRDARIEIDVFTASAVHASCQESQLYFLSILKENDGYFLSCDCPYFEAHGPCRHLYALLFILDAFEMTGVKRAFVEGLDSNSKPHYDVLHEDELAYTPTSSAATTGHHAQPHGSGALLSKGRRDEKGWQWALRYIHEWQSNLPVAPARDEEEIHYVLEGEYPGSLGELRVRLCLRRRLKSGEWGKPRRLKAEHRSAENLADPADREIMTLLRSADPYRAAHTHSSETMSTCFIPSSIDSVLLPRLCATQRFFLWDDALNEPSTPIRWNANSSYQLRLAVHPTPEHAERFVFQAHLHNGTEIRPLTDAVVLLSSGHVIFRDYAAQVEHYGLLAAPKVFSASSELEIERSDVPAFLQQLFTLSLLPPLELPESLGITFKSPMPQPVLHAVAYPADDGSTLFADVRVMYGSIEVDPFKAGCAVMDPDGNTILMRNAGFEAGLERALESSGFNIPPNAAFHPRHLYSVAPRSFPRAAEALINAGWKVMANGKPFRRVGEMSFNVSSGMDWFDLKAECDFDGVSVALPDILKAVKAGKMSIVLGDGSVGMLPEEWLERHRYLLDSAEVVDDQLRFKSSQAMLLDAVLAEQPTANFDETFMRVREKLSRFTKIDPASPSPRFKGELRPYQKEGLGWLLFLQEYGLGGCLADDMGLGKTIQVLALLTHEKRAAASPDVRNRRHLPTLVVVPRSLVFNWEREAAKFAPDLRVLRNTGPNRETSAALFEKYDLVLMTYGTVRSDAIALRSVPFDFVILDEAQAIKNANTATAKAVRLLQGRNRLALSGTPIENHIGELWSLFEFLNPGMLGSSRVFSKCVNENGDIKEGTREMVSRAVRPFILRRTKSQVAKELPEKLEETIFCELSPGQRKIYTDLRDHYRTALLGDPTDAGTPKNKFQVLEALLRLRQVACHPGLVDPGRLQDSSAKLDAFLDTVLEVVDSGRKVLAFSQFTSLLAIVRDRLDRHGIVYEYLDGKTRKRQEKVDRFQNDEDCKVFLISLKAGGYGLNLTAAEYVLLLDPWWNPAVESQAIDRAHRIGQTCKVFAYRFIARDTVEEKVLELQKTKRQLADAILGADNRLLKDLERQDLELLLS